MPYPTRKVVVITGASSGLGRATAHAFARQRANLVLCARGPEPLEAAAAECRRLGGRALAITADVRDPRALERVAGVAADTFGDLGVWVNNAGSGAVGRFWEVPLAAHRATIETNLLGAMNGAYAALPYFLAQRQGVLINVDSIGGFVPTPFAAAYAASKFGLRAFSASLRRELDGFPGVRVCAVYPYFLDTPGVQHAANYTRRALKPAPIVYAPETVAEVIVALAHEPRPEVLVGVMAKLARLGHALAPGLVERSLARTTEAYLAQADPAPVTNGRLESPGAGPMRVHGGWRRPSARGAAVTTLGLAAAGLAGWGLTRALRAA